MPLLKYWAGAKVGENEGIAGTADWGGGGERKVAGGEREGEGQKVSYIRVGGMAYVRLGIAIANL